MSSDLLIALAAAIPLIPLLTCAGLILWMFAFETPRERTVRRIVGGATLLSSAALAAITSVWVSNGRTLIHLHLGSLFAAGDYHFEVDFLFDTLSIAFGGMSLAIALLVTRFAGFYLHREEGFGRFFVLLALCVAGLLTVAFAASYDLLFLGWEMIGMSSVLLIAFFYDRPKSVRGALMALITYRVADFGLLIGSVILHRSAGSTDYEAIFDHGAWPNGIVHVSPSVAAGVSALFLLSAMGKSAQFPLGGWLPRAMEGPTPSSALFYGALSVHAGVLLLLRSEPLLRASPIVAGAVVLVGALTAIHSGVVGRVQADAKSQLAYATMGQLGVIMIEVGLGFSTLALLHMIAHAFLRGFQLLRAPSILADVRRIRAAVELSPRYKARAASGTASGAAPTPLRLFLYRVAIERFFWEATTERFFVRPILAISRALLRDEALTAAHAKTIDANANADDAAVRVRSV